MGYKNPTVVLTFPDLAADDDHLEVVIRNPRLMPAGELRSLGRKSGTPDPARVAAIKQYTDAGQDVPEELLTEEDTDRGLAYAAKLVIGWHVYDATVPDGGLLPLPATAELIGKLPQEIFLAIMGELDKVNPTKQPSPADGTGKTS